MCTGGMKRHTAFGMISVISCVAGQEPHCDDGGTRDGSTTLRRDSSSVRTNKQRRRSTRTTDPRYTQKIGRIGRAPPHSALVGKCGPPELLPPVGPRLLRGQAEHFGDFQPLPRGSWRVDPGPPSPADL